MIQMQTLVDVADNSGAKTARCIRVLGGTRQRTAGIGDIIVVSIQKSIPGAQEAVRAGKVTRGHRPLQEAHSPVGWQLRAV
jgi:large subunit ribosomal protein L14